jgi:two-component system chemotaxis response regulator CheB
VVDRLVVIGASAGGVQALQTVLGGLPADLPAAVLVVVHLPASGPSALPRVLSRAGELPAHHPVDGEPLVAGQVYVAPPDRHLVVEDSVVRLDRGPRENRQRPAIDTLFRSAAWEHRDRVVAVVLSGALDDGAVGAAIVAARDGVVLVQDPDDARVSGMPRAALAAARGARALPAARLGPEIADVVRQLRDPVHPLATPEHERTSSMAGGPSETTDLGTPAALGCPECQGGMFETIPNGTVSYTCHVGHAWSAQSLLEAQRQAVEGALYNAASKLLEIAAVHRRLAELGLDEGGGPAENLRAAEEAERRSERIQHVATSDPSAE